MLALVTALWFPMEQIQAQTNDQRRLVVLVGAAGESEFAPRFSEWGARWEKAGRVGGVATLVIGGTNAPSGPEDLARLRQALTEEPKEGTGEMWLVLVGHGTFDGQEAKFNLRGPDLSATEFAELLKPFRRPVAVINCTSASGPFLNKLSAPNRVVITATRSGHEENYARFGQHVSEAIADPSADLDKDGQTSLLEAYLYTARRVDESYKKEGLLTTEHALLDDNGDGLGTPPDWFRGIRAVKKADNGSNIDGLRAHQFHLIRGETEQRMPVEARAKRDALEVDLSHLRDQKGKLKEEDYYLRLEQLLLELAKVYEQAGKAPVPAAIQ
jgi:hypothetical protein